MMDALEFKAATEAALKLLFAAAAELDTDNDYLRESVRRMVLNLRDVEDDLQEVIEEDVFQATMAALDGDEEFDTMEYWDGAIGSGYEFAERQRQIFAERLA